MAIELITGVGADNHISSNDFRAFNRANFGQGKYILNDAENMSWYVSTSSGEIYINTGSLLWSGMHIRNASDVTLNYAAPSSSATVYVYLHYTKNTNTSVESVDFVVSVGETLTPIVDNLADNTVDAYTLFCSFTSTSSGTSNHVNGFQQIKNIEEVEKLIYKAHEEVVLFEGRVEEGGSINLSESFRNFYELEFVGMADEMTTPIGNSARVLVSQIGDVGGYISVPIIGADKFGNSVHAFTRLLPWLIQVNSDTLLTTISTNYLAVAGGELNGVSVFELGYISKIIGIGRRN